MKTWPQKVGRLRLVQILSVDKATYVCECGRECLRSYQSIKATARKLTDSACKKCGQAKRNAENHPDPYMGQKVKAK